MVHAFVMVDAATGEAETTLSAIRDLAGVTEAHVVAGDVDLIAELETDEVYDVLRTASAEIQRLSGVTETRTYVALD
ncbi:MAG: Lrp/AsnC ligand binding domain-containing protein [Haloplanus sp.]